MSVPEYQESYEDFNLQTNLASPENIKKNNHDFYLNDSIQITSPRDGIARIIQTMGIGNEKFVRTARRGFTETDVSFDMSVKKSIDHSSF